MANEQALWSVIGLYIRRPG